MVSFKRHSVVRGTKLSACATNQRHANLKSEILYITESWGSLTSSLFITETDKSLIFIQKGKFETTDTEHHNTFVIKQDKRIRSTQNTYISFSKT